MMASFTFTTMVFRDKLYISSIPHACKSYTVSSANAVFVDHKSSADNLSEDILTLRWENVVG